ncbi:MAG: ATP-dependent Clp protease adaptor ClpS [Bacteroidota bacterium]
MVKHKDNPSHLQQDSQTTIRELILFNDHVNTFDFVIETLIEVCKHEAEQAEQCAMIAHYNGKCMVKTGDSLELKPLCEEMTLRGLTVSIE